MTLKNRTLNLCMTTAIATGSLAALQAPLSAQDNDNITLEEIIVTAQKREQSLSDVPMSVGVVSGKNIKEMGMLGFQDLQGSIPNLLIHETLGSFVIRVRGLGSGASNLSFDNSVGIFVDGVYCPRSRCFQAPFLDVERVEVARGPQGALFGKGTIAGAVSIASAVPSDEFEGSITAGYEMENGGTEVKGFLSGPLSDNLGARVAIRYRDTDGYMKNLHTNTDEPKTKDVSIRGTLVWDASDSTEVIARVNTGQSDINGYSLQMRSFGTSVFGPIVYAADPNAEDDLDYNRSVTTSYPKEYDKTNFLNGSLTINSDLGPVTMTSITAYNEFDFDRKNDVDGTILNLVDTNITEDYKQLSQEVRFASNDDGALQYIFGVHYADSKNNTYQTSPLGAFINIIAPVTIPIGTLREFDQEAKTISLFGQLTYDITDKLRIIADGRYSSDKKTGVNNTNPVSYPDGYTPEMGPDLSRIIAGGIWSGFSYTQDRTDKAFDPSLKLQYSINDDFMVYASYAGGSKSGGFKSNDGGLGNYLANKVVAALGHSTYRPNFVSTFIEGNYDATSKATAVATNMAGVTFKQGNAIFDYEDETADSYELGTKMTFMDGRSTLNVALFQTDFKNLQSSSYDGTAFVIGNAANARVKGMEAEFAFQITQELGMNASVALLSAKYKNYANAQCIVTDAQGTLEVPDCVDGQGDLSGADIERAPASEINFGLNWESELTDNLLLRANASMYASGSYFIQPNQHPLSGQESFAKFDARIAVADADNNWEVALVGRNLGNKLTVQHAFGTPFFGGNSFLNSVAPPRQVTLEATFNF